MSGPRYVITERAELVRAVCACGAVVEQFARDPEGPGKQRAWDEVKAVIEEHVARCPRAGRAT